MQADPELTLTSTYHPCSQMVGILRGHLTAALALLGGPRLSGSRVHAARQELKRARAALRLLRESLDAGQFREADSTLRQAAQLLGQARDSDVLLHVCSRLSKRIKDESCATSLKLLRKQLLQERRSASSHALGEPRRAVKTLLTQSLDRTREWRVSNDVDLLTRAMQRTYRKGRACYRDARESHTDEDLHAWRKQVKYAACQLEALGTLAPTRMTRRLQRSSKLARALGRDRDLSLLHKRLADAGLDADVTLRLTNTIRRERARLQRQAFELGEQLYRIKPRQLQPLS
jgi:CHAD domain-containing protein